MATRFRIVALVLGVSLSMVQASFAQSDSDAAGGGKNRKKQDAPKQPASEGGGDAADPGLLAGPTVEQEAEQGSNNPMTAPNNVNRPRAGNAQNVPFRQWMETIRGLDLSEDQRQRVYAIVGAFQAKTTEYQQKHGEEARRLQQQVRAAREGGKDVDPAVREQLQKLEAEMPRQTDAQQEVWSVLSAEQQAAARTRFAEIEARNAERRGERREGQSGPQSANPQRPAGGRNNDKPADQTMEPSGTGGAGRNTRKTGEAGNDDQMTPTGGGMTDEPMAEPSRAAPAPERPAARRGAAAGGRDASQLDDAARKRVRFLMSRQTAKRAGNAPTPEEKSFKFDEDSAR